MLCSRQQEILNLFTALHHLSGKGKLWSIPKFHTIDQNMANRNVGNNFHATQQTMAENNPVHTLTTYHRPWQTIILSKQSHHITQNGKQKFIPQFHITLQIMAYTDLDNSLKMYSRYCSINPVHNLTLQPGMTDTNTIHSITLYSRNDLH